MATAIRSFCSLLNVKVPRPSNRLNSLSVCFWEWSKVVFQNFKTLVLNVLKISCSKPSYWGSLMFCFFSSLTTTFNRRVPCENTWWFLKGLSEKLFETKSVATVQVRTEWLLRAFGHWVSIGRKSGPVIHTLDVKAAAAWRPLPALSAGFLLDGTKSIDCYNCFLKFCSVE